MLKRVYLEVSHKFFLILLVKEKAICGTRITRVGWRRVGGGAGGCGADAAPMVGVIYRRGEIWPRAHEDRANTHCIKRLIGT